MTPKEISSYAEIDKENLVFVQNYMKRVIKSYNKNDYGIVVKDDEIKFKVPHEKCLMKVWYDKGYADLTVHRDTRFFFDRRHTSYQFAENALIRIVKLEKVGEQTLKLYGWVLSGGGTFMMINGEQKYFRPYPLWSYITILNYNKFELIPCYKKT